MKFLKEKKYSILLNIFRYSFIGILAIALILPTLFTNNYTKKANATTTNPTLAISNITQTTAFFTASGLEQPTSANPYRYSIIITDESYEQVQSYGLGNISPNGVGTETATALDWGTSYFAYIKDNTINTGGLITYQMFPFTTLGIVPIHQESVTSTNINSNSVNLSLTGLETQNIYYVVLIRLFSSNQYIENKIISVNDINAGGASTQFTNLLPNTQYTIDLDKYTTLPGGGNLTPPALLNPAYNFTTLTSSPNSPTITSFAPTSGKVGDMIVINGQNFEYATEVIFNTTTTTNLTISGSTKISVNVPSGAKTGKITVKSVLPPGGEIFNSVSANNFTLISANSPVITNITPLTGKVGDTVTINGENLIGNTKVLFNSINAVTNINTANKITVNVPFEATNGKIKITTNNGSVSSSDNFVVSGGSGEGEGDENGSGDDSPDGDGSKSNGGIIFKEGSLVPDCNTGEIDPDTGNYENPCDFNMVLALVNKVINFLLITLATPMFALILIYVGWLYLSDMGNSENITKAKKIFKNVVIGYVIALAAWLIIKTILVGVGFDPKQAFLEV